MFKSNFFNNHKFAFMALVITVAFVVTVLSGFVCLENYRSAVLGQQAEYEDLENVIKELQESNWDIKNVPEDVNLSVSISTDKSYLKEGASFMMFVEKEKGIERVVLQVSRDGKVVYKQVSDWVGETPILAPIASAGCGLLAGALAYGLVRLADWITLKVQSKRKIRSVLQCYKY